MLRPLYQDAPRLLRLTQVHRPRICPMADVLETIPPGSRTLDVGCGGGSLLMLGVLTGRVASGVGFDSSRPAIEAAQRARARLPSPDALRFEHRRVQDGWPPGLFDAVTIIDVLHHVPPAAQAGVIQLAAARLAPGGLLIYKDMCARPRWRAAANRAHDLLMARQWIHTPPVGQVEGWAAGLGLSLVRSLDRSVLWYGHELRAFCAPPGGAVGGGGGVGGVRRPEPS
ncbi:MAG: hypothetical protein C0513_03025 [Isosphaera sp.]|nr:hypothetical protein [Isosphaera sp.]